MKAATITIRLPVALRQKVVRRASRERRSLSAQVVCELEAALAQEPQGNASARGRILGRFGGACLPQQSDLAEVRALLWQRLSKTRG